MLNRPGFFSHQLSFQVFLDLPSLGSMSHDWCRAGGGVCHSQKKTHHNDANFSFTTPFITLGTWGPPLMYSKKGLTFPC